MKIIHKKSHLVLSHRLKIASTFSQRLMGLMFIKEMKEMDGLLIERCNSIHNCFVKFPIDVLFLDKNFKIVHMIKSFKPWRFSRIYFSAQYVLELPEGSILSEIKKGDELEVLGV